MTNTETGAIEWGYARVSTKGQDLARQIHALTEYGIKAGGEGTSAQRLYADKVTGKHLNRQSWQELRPRLRSGDVLVLAELDRLGRSQTEMLRLFEELTADGIHVNVIGGPIPFDTRNAGPATEMAKAMLMFLGQVELIYKRERVESARAAGKEVHRPRKLTPEVETALAEDYCNGVDVPELVEKYGVSRATVYRIAREQNVQSNPRCAPAPTGRGRSLTAGQLATARRLANDGMSVRKIAEAIGSSHATVHRGLSTEATA